MSAYELVCVKACLSPERQGKRRWVGGSSKFRRELIWFIPYSPSVKPMCCSQKKQSGRSANHFNCEGKLDGNAAEAVFPARFNTVVICGVCRHRYLEKICRCLCCALTVFLELTAFVSAAQKRCCIFPKFVAGSKSNTSKHGA